MTPTTTADFWKRWEGRVVNHDFPLRQYLGGGENSAVFLTERTREQNRPAALRLVLADSSSADLQLARWQRALKLSHPHLIPLFTTGRCLLDNTAMLYLVMEYAEENLGQVLPDRHLSVTETREMLEPVLSALRYIHAEGLVHGGLKPANIMAVKDEVKISSDGLYRMGEAREAGTAPGIYDAPEATLSGMSAADDVWSLGVTLTEVLTGRPPAFGGEPALPQEIPHPFRDIIEHCLQADPRNRWTIDQIATSLGASGQRKPIAAAKQSSIRRILVPVAALVVVGAGVLLYRSMSGSHADVANAPARVVVQPQASPPTAPIPAAPPVSEPVPPPKKAAPRVKASQDILDQPMPKVAPHSRDTITGSFTIQVRVHVDPSGKVANAKFDAHGPSDYFADRTIEAARKWRFTPSEAAQDWVLRFKFSRSGIQVTPARVTPRK